MPLNAPPHTHCHGGQLSWHQAQCTEDIGQEGTLVSRWVQHLTLQIVSLGPDVNLVTTVKGGQGAAGTCLPPGSPKIQLQTCTSHSVKLKLCCARTQPLAHCSYSSSSLEVLPVPLLGRISHKFIFLLTTHLGCFSILGDGIRETQQILVTIW